MWQKARIVNQDSHPEEIGRIVWVKERRNNFEGARDLDTGKVAEPRDLFFTNLYTSDGLPVGFEVSTVELLPEFEENPPLIKWDDFVKGT